VVGAEYVREVEPGELVVITPQGLESRRPFGSGHRISQCVFELIYFARPNSNIFGESVYAFRKLLGKTLARECPVDADIVIPVPDSGTISALGFSKETGIPFGMGLIRSHYIGRTFIEPTQRIRDFGPASSSHPCAAFWKASGW
jgi:amidophosphoribosyltransferase